MLRIAQEQIKNVKESQGGIKMQIQVVKKLKFLASSIISIITLKTGSLLIAIPIIITGNCISSKRATLRPCHVFGIE